MVTAEEVEELVWDEVIGGETDLERELRLTQNALVFWRVVGLVAVCAFAISVCR